MHLYRHQPIDEYQRNIDFLINEAKCHLVVGDFNTDLSLLRLPPDWERTGDYEGALFSSTSLSLQWSWVHRVMQFGISDHDFFEYGFDLL